MTDIEQLKKEIAFLSDEVERLSSMEMAVKLILNSGYGALGTEYFRWYDETIAEGITATGRVSIRFIMNRINTFINEHAGTENVDYISSGDTDSTYADIDDLVKSKWPGITDIQQLTDNIDEFANTIMGPYIDEEFKKLSIYLNSDQLDRLDMKREAIADKFYIRAKKNYIMRVHDNEGIRFSDPYYKFMGIESVRTSHPIIVRDAIEDCMKIIMEGSNDQLRSYIKKFKQDFMNAPINKIGSPRGISDLDKYSTSDHRFKQGVTIPINVTAAINYNRLIALYKLSNKYEYIKGGSKIKFLPLKEQNPLKSHVIGFIDDLPPEFELDEYVDKESHFDKIFIGPVVSFAIFNGWTIEENTLLDLFTSDDINIAQSFVAKKNIDLNKTKTKKETISLF